MRLPNWQPAEATDIGVEAAIAMRNLAVVRAARIEREAEEARAIARAKMLAAAAPNSTDIAALDANEAEAAEMAERARRRRAAALAVEHARQLRLQTSNDTSLRAAVAQYERDAQ